MSGHQYQDMARSGNASGTQAPRELWPVFLPGAPIVNSSGKACSAWRHAIRFFDVVIASLALIILAPALAMIAALVRATSPGPALFRQVRVGHLGVHFVMLKFRTMHDNNDDTLHRRYVSRMLTAQGRLACGPGGLFKLDRDPRITRIGGFLRRSSLDELPQLFNVLRGEMSLVGPRPALPWEVKLYKPYHSLRFQVKPGITGLWQISGRSRLTINEALDLDVRYVQSWSLGLDLWILAMTLPALLRGGAR